MIPTRTKAISSNSSMKWALVPVMQAAAAAAAAAGVTVIG
jgi:hypothetical protein